MSHLKMYCNFLVFVVLFRLSSQTLKTEIIELNYSKNFIGHINRSVEYILIYSGLIEKYPLRVEIESFNATKNIPLMVVARQPGELLSWSMPIQVESDSGTLQYNKTSRTLCKELNDDIKGVPKVENPIISISTSSVKNISFKIKVDYQRNFFIKPSNNYEISITPSEPIYFFYNWTNVTSTDYSNYNTVVLKVLSSDEVCMTVSIQNTSCPVFDLNQDITFRGFYETVDTRGGITIPKFKFPLGFYVVFVAKADDTDCTGKVSIVEANRLKNITMIIKPSISYNDYLNAVIVTLGCIALFYVLFGMGYLYCSIRDYIPREMSYFSNLNEEAAATGSLAPALEVSFNETEYDRISEGSMEKQIRFGKSNLFLSELATKDPRVLKNKSYLYLYNVLTVAIFYGLPVVQLVITYQKVLNETGEQDLCYYNFLCAHPVGVISDFNHLFSNIGYITLGILFLWITYRREVQHRDLEFDRQYGIPQHFGLFYSMGVALIMEGILSGSYHICPNHANFQFDSSFMYVMVVLCMVKLYQNRHPDINATAYTTFAILAFAIFLGMVGILDGNLYFWILFTIIYITFCLYLSLQFYYMGCWKLNRGTPLRVYRAIITDYQSGPLNVIKPERTARMMLVIVGNICNWLLAYWSLKNYQNNFGLFLLGVFMANTLLYFFFYILMKLLHWESIKAVTWFFLFCSIMCALSAMYFFMHKSISWANTPAGSRRYNQECELLSFYDFHDIWHFLSAIGMFFTFMTLLTLDDDLSHTDRSQIPVF